MVKMHGVGNMDTQVVSNMDPCPYSPQLSIFPTQLTNEKVNQDLQEKHE